MLGSWVLCRDAGHVQVVAFPRGAGAATLEELAANKVESLSCGRPTGRPLLFGLNEQSFVLAGDLSWRRVKTWACRFG